ncbi:MAG: LysM peptidoglycan-binding domain-containing protein [Lacipirellulaceae bacterium]
MISRRRKITTAAIVLSLGLLIAWPFRRSGEVQPATKVAPVSAVSQPALASSTRTSQLPGPIALEPVQESRPESLHQTRPSEGLPSTLASALVKSEPSPVAATIPPLAVAPPVTEPSTQEVRAARSLMQGNAQLFADGKRPIYSTAMLPTSVEPQVSKDAKSPDEAESEPAATDLRIHVVHNGDTLERLARRYLDDERRALEIFDLNRETLTNPHLLPIGVEIVIPAKPIAK